MNAPIETPEIILARPAAVNGADAPPDAAVVYKLKHPFEIDGKPVTEFALDLDALPGTVEEDCERLYRILVPREDQQPLPMVDSRFQLMIASRAAGFNYEDVRIKISFRDRRQICTRVTVFLGGGD
jgi:hypothetical protein